MDGPALDACIDTLKETHPELVDLYLPPEAHAGGMAMVTLNKQSAGAGPRIIEAVSEALRPLANTKFVMVFDHGDVNIRDWNDVIWAITTRMDPARDTLLLKPEHACSVMGLDATNKLEGESQREWGTPITKNPDVVAKIDALWDEMGILG
ncbi:hypothetical protein [Parasalinivibrio latis]|uniref:hypothetical protein n=1 Tax=Parasalinivibrio latis TaxID=2952610 RepID=UPI003DA50238